MNPTTQDTEGQVSTSHELFGNGQQLALTQTSTILLASMPLGQVFPASSLYGTNNLDVAAGTNVH
jgi:hypothetical protein